MGAIWACLAAKLTSSGALLEVEAQGNSVECCTCEERSSASDSPRRKDEPPPKESTATLQEAVVQLISQVAALEARA